MTTLTESQIEILVKKAAQLDNQRAICKRYHQSDKGKAAKKRAQARWLAKKVPETDQDKIDAETLALEADEAEIAADQAELDNM